VQANILYRRVRRALGWAGLPARTSVTPDEYISLYQHKLDSYPHLNQALRLSTALYLETIYSPRLPEERRVRAASHAWQQSAQEWLLLWARDRWERLRQRV
jgi:hypothetical protein